MLSHKLSTVPKRDKENRMKRTVFFLAAMLLLACTVPTSPEPTPTSDPTQPPLPLQAEVITEPYQSPLASEPCADADEVYSKTRIFLKLPANAEDVELSYIINRRGTDCAQAVFTVDGVPMWYRTAYTADVENLADDETTYPNRYALDYFGTEYLLLYSETQGRVQWYDSKTGTSNSLFVPYSVEPRILEDAAISILSQQR